MTRESICCKEHDYCKENDNKKEFTRDQILHIRTLNKNLRFKEPNRGILVIDGLYVKGSQYVGILRIKNLSIEVLPKILGDSDKETSILRNLIRMLNYSKKLKIREVDLANLNKSSDLLEIMIFIFAKNLLNLLKNRLYRNYMAQEENLNYCRGKLLISKQIKHNTIRKTNFFCEYDEYNEDVPLNRIFKATIMTNIRNVKSAITFKLLEECDNLLKEVTFDDISYSECNKIQFNRLNQEYRPIYNLSKLLLFGRSPNLTQGNQQTYSLMFDMNKLFEEFIFEFIKCELKEYVESIKAKCGGKFVFEIPENDSFGRFKLLPDMLVQLKSGKLIIIDTKYKELHFDKPNYGVSSSDIYQMILYGLRHLNMIDSKDIVLLYPQYSTDSKEAIRMDLVLKARPENINIHIRTVNLHIDLFKEKYKLKEELINILNFI